MVQRTVKKTWRARLLRPRQESWKQVLTEVIRPRFALTLFALLILSILLSRIWAFEYAGLRSQETLQRAVTAVRAEYTRTVFITPEDYSSFFGESIDAIHLDAAIDRILQFDPAVVVVDLDTSAKRFRQLKQRRDSIVIWARDAVEEVHGNEPELSLLPVHGDMDSQGIAWGLVLFPRSPDWTVRKYRRTYRIGSVYKPSLHWEAVNRFCTTTESKSVPACANIRAIAQKLGMSARGSEEEMTVPLLHARYQFEPWHLIDILGSKNAPAARTSDLSGKIVLLGGSYSPQDKHQTPFGVLDGVELVASAVEAELNPQGQREMTWVAEVGLKIILGLLIAMIHHFLRPFYALLSTTALLTFLVFFGSLMAAFFVGYRADVVPFLVGILIEQLYQGAEQAEHNLEHKG